MVLASSHHLRTEREWFERDPQDLEVVEGIEGRECYGAGDDEGMGSRTEATTKIVRPGRVRRKDSFCETQIRVPPSTRLLL